MAESFSAVILAAGKGTRLKISTPKPLCLCLERPLIDYVIEGLMNYDAAMNIGIVVGHQKELVVEHVKKNFEKQNIYYADQDQQLGTGHAVQVYFEANPKAYENEYTFIVCADTPLITADIYYELVKVIKMKNLDGVCASFNAKNPKGYGRIVKADKGFSIVEEKDATQDQKQIIEVNSGVYLFKTSYIQKHINKLNNQNNSGEFYLTDLLKAGQAVETIRFENEESFLGVNDLIQLDNAASILQERINEEHMLNGVRIINKNSVYITPDVKIGLGTVIYPNTTLMGKTIIGNDCIIESGSVIKDSLIDDEVTVKAYSYFEKAQVDAKAVIGPMARLREGSHIGESCKIGNFVETKKAILREGAKVSHLSYVGDADIGKNTNIGCGFITCNYDGANKHKTTIGENSFIGSDCQMIAPITIGNSAYIGSGSTINKDVPDDAFAIARQRQVTKEGMAKKFLKTSKNS